MLGFHCCTGFSLVALSGGYPLVVVIRLLIAVASPVAEHIQLLRTSVIVAFWLFSCGTKAPECTGSVALVHGLSCSVACGILVPQSRIEPAFPELQGEVLITGSPRKSQSIYLRCCYKELIVDA